MRRLALLVLALTAAASARGQDHLALMRGVVAETGVSNFDYAGNEHDLGAVTLDGVSGAEAEDFNKESLLQEIELFEKAQASRAAPGAPREPLHILLDPNEHWAYARWGQPFRVRYPDGRVTAPDTGFIQMGEQFDYSDRPSAVTSEDLSANRALLEELDAYYLAHVATWDNGAFAQFVMRKVGRCLSSLEVPNEPFERYVAGVKATLDKEEPALRAGGCPADDFDSWVETFEEQSPATPVSFTSVMNGRFSFALDGETGGIELYARKLVHARFRERVASLMADDLRARKLPPGVSWDGFYGKSKSKQTYARLRRRTIVSGINEALTHELGHMIHLEATGGNTGVAYGSGDPEHPDSHSLTTLSNPGFAFAEGWAEAMAYVYGKSPPDAARQIATTIDYTESLAAERRFVNGLTGKPANARALRRLEYLEDLQAHKGQRKFRHDFLASEASVSCVLLGLRNDLGPKVFAELVEVMTRDPGAGASLAPLLEAYAHARPERKLELYRSLEKSSSGILVTREQLALVERDPSLEIDLDRDGSVPGKNAAKAHPELFASEGLSFGPLALLPAGEDPLEPVTGSPGSAAATNAPVPLEPAAARDGLTRRVTNETVGFDGMESR